MARSIHLNLFVHGRGHHEAGWRHPGATRQALTDIDYFRDLAVKAEQSLFDAVFFADALALGEGARFVASGALEPITTLAALSQATSRIGLIATASTTYTEPFNLARQFASLDHISRGRIGWNIVTSWVGGAGPNFGYEQQIEHAERYARAHEFLEVVTQLWDSWADDAVVDDPASGRFLDPARVRRIGYQGKFHRVAGPLNLPRPPQGHPVLVQAGSSPTGKAFAARYAEAVFTAHLTKESAIDFYAELKAAASSAGRSQEEIVILPGISAAIGSTEAEASALLDELDSITDVSVGLGRLSNRFGGYDFSTLPLDQPLSVDDFPDASTVQAAQSRAAVITQLVARERPTLRDLLRKLAAARGHLTLSGTPEHVADVIADWTESRAADGFNVMPPVLPAQFELFTEYVVPILQKRGLFRREYEAATLRGHYGLARPANPHFES
ncbi:monooxygenase (plasmid) [Burkholderia sp. SFA1]|uniref:LLM class flavin-dependent oxidoreductase n=1 Tax=unclassified Caballeronia TaxID=2646786 RepID=UPI001F1A096A|nr:MULTISPECIES: LLM class flavin-dependent oxidoreductase [unclassified Caballeronia]MCE4547015.1 LLM class flavin-dependent oxidoreductase [Caballeronia sp. PC1]MCE4572512.1 LLM class flavin-dependent oxidoreductase [Caballeronia sp. CLC5]BBQ02117.1 monooxygenase [Burkholderia sp. SFA1]